MKVQYLQQYTDDFGFTYKCGWTAEHTDPDAERLIEHGICKRVADDVKPTKSELVTTECVPIPMGLPLEKKPTGSINKKS